MEKTTNTQKIENNTKILINILRTLSLLEKALDRLARNNYHNRNQYPDLLLELETTLVLTREWIQKYKAFCVVPAFINLLGLCISNFGILISEIITEIQPENGKRSQKKSRRIREQQNIIKSINYMESNISCLAEDLNPSETPFGVQIEGSLWASFVQHITKTDHMEKKEPISKRGKKTQIFPWTDREDYLVLMNDKKRFHKEVIDKLVDYKHDAGHKPGCNGDKGYQLKGFRPTGRNVIEEGGKKRTFPIRIAKCKGCKENFSLLPSFLPREKHFCIDIIGNLLRGILLFGHSFRSALESSSLTGYKVKSKQTILNWIKWMGAYHPAAILTRAGVKGSSYFQEDEGFEKEPNLRTYSVVMVDSETLLVWHMDYVDHVDEQTLHDSFEKFVERIDFKILGVTKDKWRASTNALKSVFRGIWIGFCHRHCLKKFHNALLQYQKEIGCTAAEVKRLYKKFKEALDTAGSQGSLKARIRLMKEPAYDHPSVSPIIEEVEKNAVYYTAHKNRKGIKKTTSLVDNFLKTVKRKLEQAQSFRDPDWTGALFRAMANVRNFVPFMSGAKNAHKSPFMLAEGETYDLPWIQTMNMHNAFLFNGF